VNHAGSFTDVMARSLLILQLRLLIGKFHRGAKNFSTFQHVSNKTLCGAGGWRRCKKLLEAEMEKGESFEQKGFESFFGEVFYKKVNS
jgi:hypothetical protein